VRLFVAVDIDPAVVQKIAECGDELRRRAAERAPRARLTWVPSERLHVTVRFIGDVDERRADALAAAVKSELAIQPFELVSEGVGVFPPRGAPRVFWARLTTGVGSLTALERDVSARLEACGLPREDRPYHPHVTLARVRDAAGLRSGPLLDGLTGRRFGAWPVNAITLVQSRPSPHGHVYVALQRTPLGTGS
jgi:2'-5' RNA ligase